MLVDQVNDFFENTINVGVIPGPKSTYAVAMILAHIRLDLKNYILKTDGLGGIHVFEIVYYFRVYFTSGRKKTQIFCQFLTAAQYFSFARQVIPILKRYFKANH